MYDNISKDNNSSKVTKPAFIARVWELLGIGTDCPVVYTLISRMHGLIEGDLYIGALFSIHDQVELSVFKLIQFIVL